MNKVLVLYKKNTIFEDFIKKFKIEELKNSRALIIREITEIEKRLYRYGDPDDFSRIGISNINFDFMLVQEITFLYGILESVDRQRFTMLINDTNSY